MKYSLLITVATSLMALAQPAMAARVTNLDAVPHVVVFETAGSALEQTVQPGRTVFFMRRDGFMGLKGGTPATSSVTSDGVLSGIVGAARTAHIPSGPNDDFVIWKDGQLRLQRRIKDYGGRR